MNSEFADLLKGNPNRKVMEINIRAAELGLSYGQYVAKEYDDRRYRTHELKRLKDAAEVKRNAK